MLAFFGVGRLSLKGDLRGFLGVSDLVNPSDSKPQGRPTVDDTNPAIPHNKEYTIIPVV